MGPRKPLSFLLLLFASPLPAGMEKVGTTSASFVKLGSGARAAALGEAYVALADDASGLAYNPAGMSQMLTGELQATHTEWFRGLRYENLNAVFSLGGGGMIGSTLNFLAVPTMPRTEQVANTPDPALNFRETGSFTPFDMQFGLAYSRPVLSGMLMGGNLKMLAQSIDDRSSVGLGLDLGVIVQTGIQGLSTGLAVQNLGTPIKLRREAYELPWTLRLGFAYKMMAERLTFLTEADIAADNDLSASIGVEYAASDRFHPRAGFRYNNIFNPWSVGMGMNFGLLGFDFSVVPFGELGLTYRGSASYRFGQPGANLEVRLPYLSTAAGKPVLLEPRVTGPDKVAAWALYIYDSGRPSRIVRQYGGKGPMPREISWEGGMADGKPAPEGVYQAVASARYGNGKVVNTRYVKLELSNSAPEAELALDPLSVNRQAAGEAFVPTVFRLALKGGRAAASWRLEILDKDAKLFRTYSGEGQPPETLSWDGRGEQGQALISGQVYQARLWAMDPLGNQAASPTPLSFRAVFR